jgi:hypothetical protein
MIVIPPLPWNGPRLVADAGILQKAAETADALACGDCPDAICRGSEFLHAITPETDKGTVKWSKGDYIELMAFLTKQSNKNVRFYAARSIMESGEWDKCLPFPYSVNRAVLDAMESEDDEVRYTMLPAVRWLADLKPDLFPQIRAGAFDRCLRALTDRDERIRVDCLWLLSAFGIDRVSSAVSDIKKALSDKNPQVQRSACDLLGWLEKDAIGAIDDVMRCLGADWDDTVRRAAAVALAKINPLGDRLRLGDRDEALRGTLINFLRDAGEVGRALRRNLEPKESNPSTAKSTASTASAGASDDDARLADALSGTELKLVKYIREKGQPVSYDVLRQQVWCKEIQDATIARTVRRASKKLLDKKLPLTVHTKNKHVTIDRFDKK